MVVSTVERVNELIDNLSDIDYITFKEILSGEGRDAAIERIQLRDAYTEYMSTRSP